MSGRKLQPQLCQLKKGVPIVARHLHHTQDTLEMEVLDSTVCVARVHFAPQPTNSYYWLLLPTQATMPSKC